VLVKSYRDLLVWQKAVDLVTDCYGLTKQLPKTEIYGLTAQIQRAAVSIPANIAEGHGREHLGDYLHHLSIANGSLMAGDAHSDCGEARLSGYDRCRTIVAAVRGGKPDVGGIDKKAAGETI
jgi:hypothetical protein